MPDDTCSAQYSGLLEIKEAPHGSYIGKRNGGQHPGVRRSDMQSVFLFLCFLRGVCPRLFWRRDAQVRIEQRTKCSVVWMDALYTSFPLKHGAALVGPSKDGAVQVIDILRTWGTRLWLCCAERAGKHARAVPHTAVAYNGAAWRVLEFTEGPERSVWQDVVVVVMVLRVLC